jgi:hypothetical protein
MFGRKKTQEVVTVTKIELSDASRQAIVALDNDLQAVRELIADVLESSTRILHALTQEITTQIPTAEDEDEPGAGIRVFADEPVMKRSGPPTGKRFNQTQHEDEDRLRNSPFTRSPRSTQVKWLREEVLSDHGWHASISVAREYANDERHFRYLRGAIGGRLREMHEEGLVERRDSHTPGSLYEYRLKP